MENDIFVNFSTALDKFSQKLYINLVELNPYQNIVCSPLSIQICAGMLRMGIQDGCVSANEMDEGLSFTSNNRKEIAIGFQNILTKYQQSNILRMANKLYIMQNYEMNSKFKDILTDKFDSMPETVDFSNSDIAADTINSWVQFKTENQIDHLVNPSVLSAETRLVLVNAIHFKCQWLKKFDVSATHVEPFYLDNLNKIEVPMMHAKNDYNYADLPELKSKALQLAYSDSNLSMLIILPNDKNGLRELEHQLLDTPLAKITSALRERKVQVKMPKFKAEFEQELTPVFLYLGIEHIFTDQAEFRKMLQTGDQIKVSEILHKALIEFNEEGTEAAAGTAIVMMFRSIQTDDEVEYFNADHPFYFTIYDENLCRLFVGKFCSPFDDLPDDSPKCECQAAKQEGVI